MSTSKNSIEGCLRAKHFYSLASEYSTSRHPLAGGVTVSHLQDAVEALAYTIALDVGAAIGQAPAFNQYWEAIVKVTSTKRLPYQGEMNELNHARVGFKHKGVVVSEHSVEKFLRNTHRFLVEASELFLSVDFDTLSEAELIADENLRSLVKAAEEHLAHDEVDEAFKRCRDSVDVLNRLLNESTPRPPSFMPRADSENAALIEWTANKFANVERTLALMKIRIDPTDYWLLHSVLPLKSMGGTYQFTRVGAAPPFNAATATEAIRILIRFALNLEASTERLKSRMKAFVDR